MEYFIRKQVVFHSFIYRLRCEMDSSTLGVLHTVDMVVVVNCLNESGAFWKGGMMFV